MFKKEDVGKSFRLKVSDGKEFKSFAGVYLGDYTHSNYAVIFNRPSMYGYFLEDINKKPVELSLNLYTCKDLKATRLPKEIGDIGRLKAIENKKIFDLYLERRKFSLKTNNLFEKLLETDTSGKLVKRYKNKDVFTSVNKFLKDYFPIIKIVDDEDIINILLEIKGIGVFNFSREGVSDVPFYFPTQVYETVHALYPDLRKFVILEYLEEVIKDLLD